MNPSETAREIKARFSPAPHGVAEPTVEGTDYSYELVRDPSLRQFLKHFEHHIVGGLKQPIVTQEALKLTKSFIAEEVKALVLGSWDREARGEAIETLDRLLESGIVNTTDGENFNQEAIRVFGSLAWTFVRYFYHYRWGQGNCIADLVSDTRRALGEHPLAQLFHKPGQKNRRQSPERRSIGSVGLQSSKGHTIEVGDADEGQERPQSRVSGPVSPEKKFSGFSELALVRAKNTGLEDLKKMLLSIPDNPIAVVEFANPIEEELALMVRLIYITARRNAWANETERPSFNYMENQWTSFDMAKKVKGK